MSSDEREFPQKAKPLRGGAQNKPKTKSTPKTRTKQQTQKQPPPQETLDYDKDDFCQDDSAGGYSKQHFWKQYWKNKKTEHSAQVESRKAIEAPTSGPGSYFTKNKKKGKWQPTNDYKLHDIRPISNNKIYTTEHQQAHDDEADNLVVEHFNVKEREQEDSVSNSSMVTFTKTSAFNRLASSPYQGKPGQPDDKYIGGRGSIKGLHYLRFIGLELLSENNFTLTFHKFFSNEVKNLIRSIENVKFSPELRAWVLPTLKYDQLMNELGKICVINNIHIEDIPKFTMQIMNCKIPYQNSILSSYDYALDDLRLKLEEFLPTYMYKQLFSYQRDGIRKGIKLYGRILINDEAGLGKSLQGLGLALAYKDEWPLVILCPAYAKFHWRYEVLKWLPGFDFQKIQILQNERECFSKEATIIIVSYDIAFKIVNRLEQLQFKICIVDDAELIANTKPSQNMDSISKVQKHLINVLSRMRRVIILSAVRILEKPVFFYPMAKMIRPDLVPAFMEYGYRYCDPRQSFEGIDFGHAGNLTELKQLLNKRFFSYNQRKSVYQDMNQKMLTKYELQGDVNSVVKIQQLIQRYVLPWEKQNPDLCFFTEMLTCQFSNWQDKFLSQATDFKPDKTLCLKDVFREIYELTGKAKLKPCVEIIDSMLIKCPKIVICALHTSLLTQIEDHLTNKVIEFIQMTEKMDINFVHKFACSPSVKVLLIDMMRSDWTDIFFVLKEHMPFGIHILICEQVWSMPQSSNVKRQYLKHVRGSNESDSGDEDSQITGVNPEDSRQQFDSSLPFKPLFDQDPSCSKENQKQDCLECVPDHSNVIYLSARYTLDEFIMQTLYCEQPALMSLLEPLWCPPTYRQDQQSKYLALNYDEKPWQALNNEGVADESVGGSEKKNPLMPYKTAEKGKNITLKDMFKIQNRKIQESQSQSVSYSQLKYRSEISEDKAVEKVDVVCEDEQEVFLEIGELAAAMGEQLDENELAKSLCEDVVGSQFGI